MLDKDLLCGLSAAAAAAAGAAAAAALPALPDEHSQEKCVTYDGNTT